MNIAILGLGEAGSLFAADLVDLGATVRGFDPADVPTPPGVQRCDDPVRAVADVELVMALTAAADAPQAFDQTLGAMLAGAVYADLSTGPASLKQRLAATAAERGHPFADVALMAIVPGRGVRTPCLASGSGAAAYRAMLASLGVSAVEVISDQAGDAAMRKLLRSVFMKGVAAVAIEAMLAAQSAGQQAWLWGNLVDEVTAADATWLSRLLRGTGPHARRRLEEMEASANLLTDLGIDAVMTRSTVESLRRVIRDGLSDIPIVPG